MPSYYPLFLDIRQMACLVIGGGSVGVRKLATLLDSGARSVLVLDIKSPSPALAEQLQRPGTHFQQRAFCENDLVDKVLVFATTGDAAVNATIAAACRQHGIFCNCADAPRKGSFIVPATATSGTLTAALSTGGASPALTRVWKTELTAWLAPRATMATFMGRLRPLVLDLQQNTRQNTQLFRDIAHSPLQNALQRGDHDGCVRLLTDLLPPALRKHIPELLYELV